MRGKVEVEQVKNNGEIVIDYDVSISPKEIYKRLKKYFPGIGKDSEGTIVGEYKGKKYAIRAKNIFSRNEIAAKETISINLGQNFEQKLK